METKQGDGVSAPVTQWFDYNRFDFPTAKPRQSRPGWYDVKRGKCRLKIRGYWNGRCFNKFTFLTPITVHSFMDAICKYPFVTAWRGLAEEPATKGGL